MVEARDRDREGLQAPPEVAGAVDRIHDPNKVGVEGVRGTLLAEESVFGPLLENRSAEQIFDFQIDLGDEITGPLAEHLTTHRVVGSGDYPPSLDRRPDSGVEQFTSEAGLNLPGRLAGWHVGYRASTRVAPDARVALGAD